MLTEKVRYETDSEAVDSWAQDGDAASGTGSTILSATSSGIDNTNSNNNAAGGIVSYDPARIALRDVFNRIPTSGSSSSGSNKKKHGAATTATTTSATTRSSSSISRPSPVKEEDSVLSSSLDTSISSTSMSSKGEGELSPTTSPSRTTPSPQNNNVLEAEITTYSEDNSTTTSAVATTTTTTTTVSSGPYDENDQTNKKLEKENETSSSTTLLPSSFSNSNPFDTSAEIIFDQDEWVSFDDGNDSFIIGGDGVI